jgi:aryl-alcohol dehydrogenase-like predicted oxidoreductase
VSELSLGGVFWGGGDPRDQAAHAIVRRALELGINYIDSAPMYGRSEEILGAALVGVSTPYLLSTKVGYFPTPFDPKDQALLRRSVENSLRLLRREAIDILIIHEPDRPGQFDWWDDHEHFTGPVTELLMELKREGKIRFTGVGGTTVYELAGIAATGFFDVVLTTFNYSLLWQEAKAGVIPVARKLDLGILLGAPLQQGTLSVRYDEEIKLGAPWLSPPRRAQYRALYAYLDELGVSLAELGLRFVLSDPDVSSVLCGVSSVAQLEANVRAAKKGSLPAEVMKRLQEIADMVPFRPYEEPFKLPFGRPYLGPGRAG